MMELNGLWKTKDCLLLLYDTVLTDVEHYHPIISSSLLNIRGVIEVFKGEEVWVEIAKAGWLLDALMPKRNVQIEILELQPPQPEGRWIFEGCVSMRLTKDQEIELEKLSNVNFGLNVK